MSSAVYNVPFCLETKWALIFQWHIFWCNKFYLFLHLKPHPNLQQLMFETSIANKQNIQIKYSERIKFHPSHLWIKFWSFKPFEPFLLFYLYLFVGKCCRGGRIFTRCYVRPMTFFFRLKAEEGHKSWQCLGGGR